MSATIDARWAPAAQYVVDLSSSSSVAAAEMRHDIDTTDFSAHRRDNYYDPRYVSSSTTAHDNSVHAAAYRAGTSSSSSGGLINNNNNNNNNNKYSTTAAHVAAASLNTRTRSRSAFGASIPPPPSWDDEPLPSAYAQASAQAFRDVALRNAAAALNYDDRPLPTSPTRRTKAATAAAGNVGFPVAANGYAYGAHSSGYSSSYTHGYSSSAGHGQVGDDDADAYSYSYHSAQSGAASSAGSPQRSPTRPSHNNTAPRLTQSASTPVTGGLSRADSGDSGDSYGSARSRTTSRDYNHINNNNNNTSSGIDTPRSRIPTRPRAYSASTASDYNYQETLTDHPPVPPLPSSSSSQPSQSFPQSPPSPSQSSTMSVSSRAAPDQPHRLVSGGAGGSGGGAASSAAAAAAASSGIPVLKTRARSMARAPSPDLLANGEMLSDEKPPFRVDLDAALAEIEDELEVRAIQRFAYARPSATGSSRVPRKSMSNSSPPPLGHQSTGSTGSSPGISTLTSSTSSFTPSSLPIASNRQLRAKSKSISSKNGVAASAIPRPRTPNSGTLGRSGTLDRGDHLSASQTSATSTTTTVNGRKRHGSDSVSNNATTPAATRQRKQSTTTPKARAAAAARAATASPQSSIPTLGVGSTTTTPAASRLGVAAHLIPPENDFTPPKGADWDDVVLPTVAKKLGISVVNNTPTQDASAASDDDLAVEWDKDGTPVRWEKRPRVANGQLATADINSRYESPAMAESPTRPPANGGADVAPLRASAGKPTTLASPSFPPPQHQPAAQQNAGQFVPPPQPYPPAQTNRTQQDRFRPPADFVPPPVFQAPAQQGSGSGKGKKGRKDDGGDDVGKGGCACVIM